MDISLDQAIEVREKAQDELESGTSADILNEEEDQANMPETASSNQSGSGLQYQFRNTENNQVTYRVVQVGGDENNQQATLSIVSTNGIFTPMSQEENTSNNSQQVALVASPFNSDSGNEGTSNSGTGNNPSQRFAYFHSGSGSSDLPSPTSTGNASSGQTEQQMLSGAGQFYVMMSPQDMLPGGTNPVGKSVLGRNFTPRGEDGSRNVRDDTKRVQHNEVERRRRDKINTWIMKLATMIPECANDHTKQGQSKGGILAKACDHITDLHHANSQLSESVKEYEQTQINYELCRHELEEAKQKIEILTQTLQAHGISIEVITSQAQQQQ